MRWSLLCRKSNLFVVSKISEMMVPFLYEHSLWTSGSYRGCSGAHLCTHFVLCVTWAHLPGRWIALQIFCLKNLHVFSGSPTSHSLIFLVKFLQFHTVSLYGFWDKNDTKECYFLPLIYYAENLSEFNFIKTIIPSKKQQLISDLSHCHDHEYLFFCLLICTYPDFFLPRFTCGSSYAFRFIKTTIIISRILLCTYKVAVTFLTLWIGDLQSKYCNYNNLKLYR